MRSARRSVVSHAFIWPRTKKTLHIKVADLNEIYTVRDFQIRTGSLTRLFPRFPGPNSSHLSARILTPKTVLEARHKHHSVARAFAERGAAGRPAGRQGTTSTPTAARNAVARAFAQRGAAGPLTGYDTDPNSGEKLGSAGFPA